MTPARSEALSKIQLTADIDSLPQDVISYFVEIQYAFFMTTKKKQPPKLLCEKQNAANDIRSR